MILPTNINNGRVDIKTPNTNVLFAMKNQNPLKGKSTTFRNPTEGLWTENLLSQVFFSDKNIQIIQNGLRAGIYRKSKGQYVIAPQQGDTLKIIMRSVFLSNAKNLPTNITEQVENLNQLVLDYTIQQVYGELKGYLKYLDDASTLVVPIAHPVMANNTDRELEFKSWF